MNISNIVCGTGGWSGPKPGDPDNFSVLTATPAFGGIDVNWTFPLTNAHAVAHTYVYRGVSEVFEQATRVATVNSDYYADRGDHMQTPIRYYYWIQFVSINGTIGEVIGPASAVSRPAIEDVIRGLTGIIDAGYLAQSLKTRIDKIEGLEDGLTETKQYLENEDAALASVLEAMQVTVDETSAAILNESLVRADETSSLAQQLSVTQSSLEDNIASVEVRTETKIETVGNIVTEIGALYTAKVDVNGLVGGFGVYNDGTIVEAGFDVDRFWVGRTSADLKKPFIIENEEVFIDQAVVNKITFNKLIDSSGEFLVENGKIRAQYLEAQAITADMIGAGIYDVGRDGYGVIRTTGKEWMDNTNGFFFEGQPNGRTVMEMKAGDENYFWLDYNPDDNSSSGAISLNGAFYADSTGYMEVYSANVIGTLQLKGNSVSSHLEYSGTVGGNTTTVEFNFHATGNGRMVVIVYFNGFSTPYSTIYPSTITGRDVTVRINGATTSGWSWVGNKTGTYVTDSQIVTVSERTTGDSGESDGTTRYSASVPGTTLMVSGDIVEGSQNVKFTSTGGLSSNVRAIVFFQYR